MNIKSKVRLVLLATVAAGALAFGGIAVAASSTTSPSTHAGSANAVEGNVAERIKHLHDALKITPALEARWTGVAQVMQDNAMSLDSAVKDRETNIKSMSAVDDIRSFQAITEEHAAGLKKFAEAFSPLYSAMSPEQQKNADFVFRHRTEAAGKHARTHG